MTFGRGQIDVGMEVADTDQTRVGKVGDVSDTGFVLYRSGHAELTVPYEAVQAIVGDRIVLRVPASELGRKDFDRAMRGDVADTGRRE